MSRYLAPTDQRFSPAATAKGRADLKRGEVGAVDGRRQTRVVDQDLPQLCPPLRVHAAAEAPHKRVQQPPDGKPPQDVLSKKREAGNKHHNRNT